MSAPDWQMDGDESAADVEAAAFGGTERLGIAVVGMSAFIECGGNWVRADHIESYQVQVHGFDGEEHVEVVSLSRMRYDFHGTLTEFETRLAEIYR